MSWTYEQRAIRRIMEFLRQMTPEQKERVLKARAWCHYHFRAGNHRRCLIGHALDLKPRESIGICSGPNFALRASFAFDELCDRYGVGRVVMLIRLLLGRGK